MISGIEDVSYSVVIHLIFCSFLIFRSFYLDSLSFEQVQRSSDEHEKRNERERTNERTNEGKKKKERKKKEERGA
jgi:hypothetical protein